MRHLKARIIALDRFDDPLLLQTRGTGLCASDAVNQEIDDQRHLVGRALEVRFQEQVVGCLQQRGIKCHGGGRRWRRSG